MRRISEQDEFLLSCLLDGDLPTEQADALRERLDREPELRAAFKALSKVNDLLVSRRAEAPSVDLRALHARVMEDVQERSARPSVLRLPFWVRLAVPLAAAAAVALVVTGNLHRRGSTGPGDVAVVQNNTPNGPAIEPSQRSDDPSAFPKPSQKKPSRMLAQGDDAGYNRARVRFNRPAPAMAKSQIRVSYVRSTELANAVKASDEERRSRPSWTSYVAEARTPRRAVVEELPPL